MSDERYDNGGWLPPSTQPVVNRGPAERVLTADQSREDD
jgi:hypothetical protein